jgi:drug/metabolite transporter (DMT)-like permease
MYPFLLSLAAAVLFGISTPISKGFLSQWSSQQLAGMLYLGAALGVAIPLIAGRKGFVGIRLTRINLARLGGSILFGGILAPFLLLAGLQLASAASVSLWLNLEMVATAMLGVAFFRDHLGRKGWLGAACVLGAGLLLSWGEVAAGMKAGILLALACVCWGIDNNLTALIDGFLPLQSTFWKGAFAGVVNLSIGLSLRPAQGISPQDILFALALGAISYGASIVLYVTAAHHLGASRSQMVFASAPLFGLIFSFLWAGERILPLHLCALGFQAAGTWLLFRDRHAHIHAHEEMEHTHEHRHDDGHHDHVHPGRPASTRHSHSHMHSEMRHEHPHWPDLHHRHAHGHGDTPQG